MTSKGRSHLSRHPVKVFSTPSPILTSKQRSPLWFCDDVVLTLATKMDTRKYHIGLYKLEWCLPFVIDILLHRTLYNNKCAETTTTKTKAYQKIKKETYRWTFQRNKRTDKIMLRHMEIGRQVPQNAPETSKINLQIYMTRI